MTLVKTIATSVAGALLLSSAALGQKSSTSNKSSSKCTAIAIGYSEGKNQEIVASASASAAKYLCTGEGDPHQIAEATASAFAAAIAYAAASCVLVGDATANAHASANAKAQAEIWVTSYFDAYASATDCETCEAWASSWGYISKYVFLQAVANAEVKLDLATTRDLRAIAASVSDYKSDIETVVATAYADALADAYAYKGENGCVAWVNAEGCIWTEGTEDEQYYCAGCAAAAYSEGDVDAVDALAEAEASAFALSCGDSISIADAHATAQALATACAEALSVAWVSCYSDTDDGYACGSAGSTISVWVEAVARAWAGAWAAATDCDHKCDVNVDVLVDAVLHLLVDASTEAYAFLCQNGAGYWSVQNLAYEINSRSACAVAEAIALAISSPEGCLAGGIALAENTEGPCH